MKDISSDEFQEKKSSKINFVVDLYADWCMPCKRLGPVLEKIAESEKNIEFCKINIDKCKDVAEELEVMSIPCVVFFKEGSEVDRTVGLVSEATIKEKLGLIK